MHTHTYTYMRAHVCTHTHTHTFHELDSLSNVILVLALDEVPGIGELDLICEAIFSDTLTIGLLMSLLKIKSRPNIYKNRPNLAANFSIKLYLNSFNRYEISYYRCFSLLVHINFSASLSRCMTFDRHRIC